MFRYMTLSVVALFGSLILGVSEEMSIIVFFNVLCGGWLINLFDDIGSSKFQDIDRRCNRR